MTSLSTQGGGNIRSLMTLSSPSCLPETDLKFCDNAFDVEIGSCMYFADIAVMTVAIWELINSLMILQSGNNDYYV